MICPHYEICILPDAQYHDFSTKGLQEYIEKYFQYHNKHLTQDVVNFSKKMIMNSKKRYVANIVIKTNDDIPF